MITEQQFADVLQALSRTLPRFKPWDGMALSLAWMTFPQKAKQELTPEMWLYAAGQRRLDPSPSEDQPLDIQLLAYVFANENGRPNVAWGLKPDLSDRMKRPHLFNPHPVPGQISPQIEVVNSSVTALVRSFT